MSTIHGVQGGRGAGGQGSGGAGELRRGAFSPLLPNSSAPLLVFTKGAPREVLALCSQILLNGEVCPLDQRLRAEILAANDDFARGALRVLALARRELPARSGAFTTEKVEQDLTFLGLIAMMDPPRPEVAKAVETFRQAVSAW
jgi:magnesium-transporting ATPase (P-type)